MHFFIPLASSAEEAERRLEGIAKFVQRPVPPIHERIFRLVYRHHGVRYVAEVGQPIDDYYQSVGPVIAIFGGNPLLICMRDRGVLRGGPIFVSNESVEEAVFFEETAD